MEQRYTVASRGKRWAHQGPHFNRGDSELKMKVRLDGHLQGDTGAPREGTTGL